MPLHDLVGLGKADAAPAFFGREVQLEDFFAYLRRDSGALISDFGHNVIVLSMNSNL